MIQYRGTKSKVITDQKSLEELEMNASQPNIQQALRTLQNKQLSGLEPYHDVNVRPVSSSSDPKDLSKPLLNAKLDASGAGNVKQSIISFPVQPAAAI